MYSTLVWLWLHLSVWLLGASGYQSHHIATPDGSLHYLEAPGQGELPPILLLHGLGSQASDLYPLMLVLRPLTRKVLAVDLPAHGLTQLPVDKLELTQLQHNLYAGLDQILATEPPVILFGNSLGGLMAMYYALQRPDNLAGLSLVSPAGAQLSPAAYVELEHIFLHEAQQEPSRLVARLFNAPPPFSEPLAEFLQARFRQAQVQALMQQLKPELSLQPVHLQGLHLPVLLIWGQSDRIFSEGLDFYKRYLPSQSQIVEPVHFTHSPYLESQMETELGRLILDWMMQQHKDRPKLTD